MSAVVFVVVFVVGRLVAAAALCGSWMDPGSNNPNDGSHEIVGLLVEGICWNG